MRRCLPALLLLAVACGSSTPQNPYRPTVTIDQLNELNFNATTRVPLTIEVQIQNTSIHEITVRKVRLEGGLSQQYVVSPGERAVTEVIPPGQARGVQISLTAVSQQGRIADAEPLNLRGFVTYIVGEQQYQDFYVFRAIVQ